MQLQIDDRLTDETGDYEIIGRPYTTQMGENVRARQASRERRGHDDQDVPENQRISVKWT